MESPRGPGALDDDLVVMRRLSSEHAWSREARREFIADHPPPNPTDPHAPDWRARVEAICDAKMRKDGGDRDARVAVLVKRARAALPDDAALMTCLRVLLHSLSRDGATGDRVCCRCGLAGRFFCKGCKGAWYCGPECQRASWKAHHKVMCEQVKIARQELHAAREGS